MQKDPCKFFTQTGVGVAQQPSQLPGQEGQGHRGEGDVNEGLWSMRFRHFLLQWNGLMLWWPTKVMLLGSVKMCNLFIKSLEELFKNSSEKIANQ